MYIYIITFIIIYFFYIYPKPLLIKNHNNYIKFLIEKNIIILFLSIIVVFLNNNSKVDIIMSYLLIFLNLILWIHILKYQHINNLKSEQFNDNLQFSDMKKDYNIADINISTNNNKVEFKNKNNNHINAYNCYNLNDKYNFLKSIKCDEDALFYENKYIKPDTNQYDIDTIDIALNSDNMFTDELFKKINN